MFKPKILQINILKALTSNMTQLLQQQLKVKCFSKLDLIILYIDSIGGSPVQAKQIQNTIQHYASTYKAPIYTFAGSQVLNSANILLSCGNKVFSSKYSKIGDFGSYAQTVNVTKFQEDLSIKFVNLQQGKHKIRLNPFQPIEDEDIQWLKELRDKADLDLQKYVTLNRLYTLKCHNFDYDHFNQLFEEPLMDIEKAKELKYIDEIGSISEVLDRDYKSYSIKQVFNKDNTSIQREILERLFA